jgi:hypothetical protein
MGAAFMTFNPFLDGTSPKVEPSSEQDSGKSLGVELRLDPDFPPARHEARDFFLIVDGRVKERFDEAYGNVLSGIETMTDAELAAIGSLVDKDQPFHQRFEARALIRAFYERPTPERLGYEALQHFYDIAYSRSWLTEFGKNTEEVRRTGWAVQNAVLGVACRDIGPRWLYLSLAGPWYEGHRDEPPVSVLDEGGTWARALPRWNVDDVAQILVLLRSRDRAEIHRLRFFVDPWSSDMERRRARGALRLIEAIGGLP